VKEVGERQGNAGSGGWVYRNSGERRHEWGDTCERERERRGGGHVAVKCWVSVGGVHGPRVPMEIEKTTVGFP